MWFSNDVIAIGLKWKILSKHNVKAKYNSLFQLNNVYHRKD